MNRLNQFLLYAPLHSISNSDSRKNRSESQSDESDSSYTNSESRESSPNPEPSKSDSSEKPFNSLEKEKGKVSKKSDPKKSNVKNEQKKSFNPGDFTKSLAKIEGKLQTLTNELTKSHECFSDTQKIFFVYITDPPKPHKQPRDPPTVGSIHSIKAIFTRLIIYFP